YSFTDLMGEDWAITDIQSEEPTSYQIVDGEKSDDKDESVLTQISDTDVIATGTGTALVTLEKEDEEPVSVSVTVDAAPLSLIFLTGQSNMEGMVGNNALSDYENANGSIVLCEEGQIYSTYAPTTYDTSSRIAYVNFSGLPSTLTADEFVPESLTSDLSRAGNELDYKANSLSASGQGKSGVDSGLAYEWNQLTGDKVWIVNTAWSGTSIKNWVPDTTYYERADAIHEQALLTYQAEADAGHFEKSSILMFWLQGEADYEMSLEDYENYFLDMYNGFSDSCGLDAIGIISVRASSGSYTNAEDIVMTPPRIAQYSLGSSSDCPGIYLVTNVNEQWVTDEGVRSYFEGGISYPTRSGESPAIPKCVDDVHPAIHYTQIGHNENGITAADGMYKALFSDESASGVVWRGSDGLVVSEVSGFSYIDSDIVVPSAQPISLAKTVSYSVEPDDSEDSGSAEFDLMTATVSYQDPGICYLVADTGADDDMVEIGRLEIQSIDGAEPGFFYSEELDAWYYFDENCDIVPYAIVEDPDGIVYDTGEPTWWYIQNSKVMISYTGFGWDGTDDWVYVTDGQVTFAQNSVIEGTVDGTPGWWYVVGGTVQTSYTGVADYANDNGWWYVKNGMVDFTKTGVEQNSYGWWYVTGGRVDFSFTGLAENDYGWWYIADGKVDFSFAGLVQNDYGWWYVTGGQVQFNYTGVADFAVDGVWWYIKNGMPDPTYTGLASNSNGTWYVSGGRVDLSLTGFLQNGSDWLYLEGGQVRYDVCSVIEGTVNGQSGWWYVVNGKVQLNYTGVSNYANAYGYWYIQNGRVDFSKNGVEQNDNGWWYVLGGQVDFSYTGVVNYTNDYGWWYVEGGKVDFSFTGIAQNNSGYWYVENGKVDFNKNGDVTFEGNTWNVTGGQATLESGFYQDGGDWYYYKNGQKQPGLNDILEGTVNGTNGWWYVVGGKVQFNYTGVSNYGNANGWWYIKDGKVDFSKNSVEQNNYGWWYVLGGKVDFSYTGVGNYSNANGWWYVNGGKVDFSKTGIEQNNWGWWRVVNGKVDFSCNSVEQNDYGWWYVVGGQVDFGYTGVANYANAYGWWYISGGKVDFGFTGTASNNYGTWNVESGKVIFDS
ncbi:MAG: hypothetical protein LUD72_13165, partial [Bacteroidales bacterium]|nr:hypothetical protein [Bacteroidales bacterium]